MTISLEKLAAKDPDDFLKAEMLRDVYSIAPYIRFDPTQPSHAGSAGLSVSVEPINKLRLVQWVFDQDAFH